MSAGDDSETTGHFHRLEQALEVWLEYVDGEDGRSPEEFLATVDPELRPLVESMLMDVPEESGDAEPGAVVVEGFRIRREIGRGGMGVVYEAEDIALERRVALKVLGSQFAASPMGLQRFRREAAATARLRHPGIVEVYGTGVSGGVHWIAMEFVDGDNLADLFARGGPLGVISSANRGTELAEVAAQVAEALHYAHQKNVVHRDIKPHNVLVSRDGSVKIVDFGLARLLDREALSITGDFAGSLAFASPEQVDGVTKADARTDQWSLGVLLYEGLAGVRPFVEDSQAGLIRAILSRDPAPPPGPNDLRTICLKALEKRPERRFRSAADMAEDLRRFLGHEPIVATPPTSVSRAVRFLRRRRWPVGVAVVGLVAIAVFAQQNFLRTEYEDSAVKSLRQVEALLRAHPSSVLPSEILVHRERVEAYVTETERQLTLAPADPERQEIAARAQETVARLYQLLKLPDEALQAHTRALQLFDQLLAGKTTRPSLRHQRASAAFNRHILERALGRDAVAHSDLDRAIQDWQSAATTAPDEKTVRAAKIGWARALSSRGEARSPAPDAARDFAASERLWVEIGRSGKLTAGNVRHELESLLAHALHRLALGRFDGLAESLDALEERAAMLRAREQYIPLTSLHARILSTRAQVARLQGKPKAARQDLERAAKLGDDLAASGAADYRIAHAAVQFNLAALLLERGADLPRAGQLLEESRRHLAAVLSQTPNLVHVQLELSRVCSLRAFHHVVTKQPPETTEPLLREAVRRHTQLVARDPRALWKGYTAEAEYHYGNWLRGLGRLDEARPLLHRATRGTEAALTVAQGHPVFTRNRRHQYAQLFNTLGQLRAEHEEFAKVARHMVAAGASDPAIVRMAIRAMDTAIVRHPGPHKDKNAYAYSLVPIVVEWMRAADAAEVPWRQERFAKSLVVLPLHPKVRPLLQSR